MPWADQFPEPIVLRVFGGMRVVTATELTNVINEYDEAQWQVATSKDDSIYTDWLTWGNTNSATSASQSRTKMVITEYPLGRTGITVYHDVDDKADNHWYDSTGTNYYLVLYFGSTYVDRLTGKQYVASSTRLETTFVNYYSLDFPASAPPETRIFSLNTYTSNRVYYAFRYRIKLTATQAWTDWSEASIGNYPYVSIGTGDGATPSDTVFGNEPIITGDIAAGAITASKITVVDLSAISANMGSITAGTITGGTMQTTTAGNFPRIVFDSSGFRSEVSAGNYSFIIDAATGAATFSGSIAASSFTGSTFQTSSTNPRVILNSLGIASYTAGGTTPFFLDASTGVLTSAGQTSTGGVFTGGVFTAGAFQTASTANNKVILRSDGLTAYGSTTTPFRLDTAGNLSVTGTVTGSSITGSAITGSRFQTGNVYLDALGIRAFTAGGTTPFNLDTSGNLTLTGTVVASTFQQGTFTGGGFTGGLFQTAATSNNKVMLRSDGLYAFGSTTTPFTLDTSGNLTLTGSITGSTITGSTITGNSFTGGIFQTAATANNKVFIRSDGLYAFGSTTTPFALDTAGNLVIAGGTTAVQMTGGIIQGSTLRTAATPPWVVMDQTGLYAIGTGGVQTFRANAADGVMYVKGVVVTDSGSRLAPPYLDAALGTVTPTAIAAQSITAGHINVTFLSALSANVGTLLSGLIVGPVYRTAVSGVPALQLDNQGIRAWNSDGSTPLQIIRNPANTNVFDMTLSGGVITGGAFQTANTANNKVQLRSNGLYAFGSTTTPFSLDTTGNLTLTGDITAGANSNYTGGTYTGGTFRTSASANKIQMRSDGIVSYFNGTTPFFLSADGQLKLAPAFIGDNLVGNGSFELADNISGLPTGWIAIENTGSFFSTTADHTDGDKALRLGDGVSANFGVGSLTMPTNPGETYIVRAKVYHSNGNGTWYMRVQEQGSRPTTDYITSTSRTSFTDLVSNQANSVIQSTTFSTAGAGAVKDFLYTVPVGIYWINVAFYNWGSSTGFLYVDEVEFRKQLSTNNIKAGAITANLISATAIDGKFITGAVITGGIFQTASTSNNKVIMRSDGIYSFGSTTTPFSLSTSSSTITGGTIQTAASGARTSLDSAGLHGYDSSNSQKWIHDNSGLLFNSTGAKGTLGQSIWWANSTSIPSSQAAFRVTGNTNDTLTASGGYLESFAPQGAGNRSSEIQIKSMDNTDTLGSGLFLVYDPSATPNHDKTYIAASTDLVGLSFVSTLLAGDGGSDWTFNTGANSIAPTARVWNNGVAGSHTSSGNWQVVTLSTERYDATNMHSTSSNTSRITITQPGVYRFGANIDFVFNATGIRGINVRLNAAGALNGGTILCSEVVQTVPATFGTTLNVQGEWKLAANDHIEVYTFQNTGGTLNYGTGVGSAEEFWCSYIASA